VLGSDLLEPDFPDDAGGLVDERMLSRLDNLDVLVCSRLTRSSLIYRKHTVAKSERRHLPCYRGGSGNV
jgi:hypothetical protein